jgi:Flp pilus assembly protein TadG
MRYSSRRSDRRGTILPLLFVGLIGLFGLVALAIDIGMLAVARAQAQNVADTSAMAGARTLNGDVASNNNYSAVTPAAIAAATSNYVMGNNIVSEQCTIDVGSYYYDAGVNKFLPNYTGKAGTDNWSLCRSTIAATGEWAFARVLGLDTFNVTAQATSVHRPRDVAVIMDFSGSMRFQSLLAIPHSGTKTTSMNPETVYPRFGHYEDELTAKLRGTAPVQASTGEYYGLANVTVTTESGPPIVEDFYQHNLGAPTKIKAFAPASSGYETTPGGDNYLRKNLNAPGQPYAKNIQELLNLATVTNGTYDALFQTNGYEDSRFGLSQPFSGYTQGPNYWGKSFFIWPPDPRWSDTDTNLQKDWRKKFFKYPSSSTRMDDNSRLWDTSGNWRTPRSGSTDYYNIDYAAILNWIKNVGPNPFPTQLRAGRILYYDAIPSSIDTSAYPPTNLNERFWKEYIDHVLGVKQTGSSTWSQVVTQTGYGDDYAWGTVKITANSSLTGTAPNRPYMHYQDNPRRPRLHFWFSPMTLIDFAGNYNQSRFWWPGTVHEAQCWQCKVGIQAALRDIELNHPNDWVGLMYFSSPKDSGSNATGRFNRARVALGKEYNTMEEALWFPFNTLGSSSTEIRPYDGNMLEVPHADGGTTAAMGFMLAYNQLSSNQTSSLRYYGGAAEGINGGRGRKGAQKIAIFETDGMANIPCTASFTNSGAYQSYYRIRQGSTNEYPSLGSFNIAQARTDAYAVVDRMVALDSDAVAGPGYSTPRNSMLVHCLAFGALFEPEAAGTEQTQALDFLHTVEVKGKTAIGSSLPAYKTIIGTADERIAKIKDAFTSIMQDGKQVTLIE